LPLVLHLSAPASALISRRPHIQLLLKRLAVIESESQ